MHIIQSEISQERSKIMNFDKRSYQPILRYLYTEAVKRQGEISLHKHFKNVKATLHVRPDTIPKFCKPRSVPYALREPIEKELDRLVQQGVLEKVEYSEWAASIVAVTKPDGNVRICGDYKVTINQYLEVDKHPLPKAEDVVELSGGERFSKLDLKNAYNQIMLDDNSREFVGINTHKGLFRPTRLPYGAAPASAIFQSDGAVAPGDSHSCMSS